MITDLDEFLLYSEDGGNFHVLEAAARFRKLTPEARERLRKKWMLEKRVQAHDEDE